MSTTTTGLAVRLIALTIAGLGSMVWVAAQVGKMAGPAGPFASTYSIEVEFRDATGLYPGDDVRVAGVKVGRVGDITVKRGRAVTSMVIDGGHPLPRDATFELRWRSVLGQRFVQVLPPEDAPPDGPALADGARVPVDATSDAADLTALLADLEPLLGSLDTGALNRVMTTLAGVLDGRDRQVGEAIASSNELMAHLSARADRLGGTITDLGTFLDGMAQRDEQVTELLDALATTSSSLAGQAGSIGDAIAESGELAHVLDEVLAANDDELATVIDQLRQVTGTVAARDREFSEGLRTLAWSSAALLRTTSHGDWMQIYGRGFGFINTFTPEPRLGPDYSDVGPDDTEAPEPVLGQPHVPLPPLPEVEVGPLTVNPGGDDDPTDDSAGLDRLLLPLRPDGGTS